MAIAETNRAEAVDEQSIFLTALEKSSPDERRAWLTQACGANNPLRQRIESLLTRHDDAGSFLENPPPELEYTQALAGTETRDDAVGKEAAVSLDFLSPSSQAGSLGRIGTYEVQSVVGRGGMGIVLKAQDTRLNRTVAVKVLAPELAANATARKRFLREAQAAAAVVHPHVVTIHAVDEDMLPFLVMELVPGISLREKIEQDGPLELAEILRIGSQVASGLAAAHKQGLIHRDIKPANILLEDGIQRVKVTDFGLARAAHDLEITQTGEIAGTPQYMSPEQAKGDSLDARSDLFSLGSVLYAMCAGRSPFRANSAIAVIRRVCDDTPRPVRELNPNIPDWLAALINRLLAKNPADRPQSAQEVADLLAVGQASSLPVGTALRGVPRVERSPSRRWPLIATSLAGFLLAAFGIWVIIKDKQGRETGRIEVPDGGSVTVETDSQPKAAATNSPSPLPTIQAAERQAFVILGDKGVAERKFDTLAEAVQRGSSGDTIEVRGNGPFTSGQIDSGHSLRIRAGSGFRPIIRLNQAGINSKSPLIVSRAPLVLEGLELHRIRDINVDDSLKHNAILRAYGEPIHVANCRLLGNQLVDFLYVDSPLCRLTNCEFLSGRPARIDFQCRDKQRITIDNCVLNQTHIGLECHRAGIAGVNVKITHSTCGTSFTRELFGSKVFHIISPSIVAAEKDRPQSAVAIDFSNTVVMPTLGTLWASNTTPTISASHILLCALESEREAPVDEVDAFVRHFFRWRGEHNVYPLDADYVRYTVGNKNITGPFTIGSLEKWRQFWGSSEMGCIQGTIKLQGGEVLIRATRALEKLTPDDFRLHPDSAGYRAGPDGKDLGANIDLVGPGPAYERWKRTPEYQQWLRETTATDK